MNVLSRIGRKVLVSLNKAKPIYTEEFDRQTEVLYDFPTGEKLGFVSLDDGCVEVRINAKFYKGGLGQKSRKILEDTVEMVKKRYGMENNGGLTPEFPTYREFVVNHQGGVEKVLQNHTSNLHPIVDYNQYS